MMGWQKLIDILWEGRESVAAERSSPPVACPNDGTPLEEGPGGVLHCPFDGWQYPHDWSSFGPR